MTESDTFTMAEEFAEVDFNEERLEKRFRKTMETLAKDPRKSIYGSGANRAEAKAMYNMPGNDKFNKSEIPRAHRAATKRRGTQRQSIMTAGEKWKATDISATRPCG